MTELEHSFDFIESGYSTMTPNQVESLTQFGPFKILEHCHHAPLFDNYRAVDTRLDRVVGLALFSLEACQQPALKPGADRFFAMIQAIANTQCPGVVELFEFGQFDRTAFISFRDVPAKALLSNAAPTNPQQAIRYLIAMASTLKTLNSVGVRHCNLNPHNVCVIDGALKLSGFGHKIGEQQELVFATTFSEGFNKVSAISEAYTAPEVSGFEHEYSAAAQIYSLGCLGYFLMTGQPSARDSNELGQSIQDALPPQSPVAELSKQLFQFLEQCTAEFPDDRLQELDQFIEAARSVAAKIAIQEKAKSSAVVVLVIIAALLVALSAAMAFGRNQQQIGQIRVEQSKARATIKSLSIAKSEAISIAPSPFLSWITQVESLKRDLAELSCSDAALSENYLKLLAELSDPELRKSLLHQAKATKIEFYSLLCEFFQWPRDLHWLIPVDSVTKIDLTDLFDHHASKAAIAKLEAQWLSEFLAARAQNSGVSRQIDQAAFADSGELNLKRAHDRLLQLEKAVFKLEFGTKNQAAAQKLLDQAELYIRTSQNSPEYLDRCCLFVFRLQNILAQTTKKTEWLELSKSMATRFTATKLPKLSETQFALVRAQVEPDLISRCNCFCKIIQARPRDRQIYQQFFNSASVLTTVLSGVDMEGSQLDDLGLDSLFDSYFCHFSKTREKEALLQLSSNMVVKSYFYTETRLPRVVLLLLAFRQLTSDLEPQQRLLVESLVYLGKLHFNQRKLWRSKAYSKLYATGLHFEKNLETVYGSEKSPKIQLFCSLLLTVNINHELSDSEINAITKEYGIHRSVLRLLQLRARALYLTTRSPGLVRTTAIKRLREEALEIAIKTCDSVGLLERHQNPRSFKLYNDILDILNSLKK